MEKKKREIIAS